SIMGGTQRLANGNTLITFSTQNRLIEVTQDGKIVWDYTNRFTDEKGRQYILFKTHKYLPEGTEWGAYLKQSVSMGQFCAL
ncbi:arylsulfotransferase family protein, partial [Patescibacteria group bacterium]|nr:arylsulfotransferase family protein [Patescibacteria group bacterium]